MLHRSIIAGLLATVLATMVASGAFAARRASATGFLFESLTMHGTEYRYTLYVPRAYDGKKPWPLILFLHGSGESGSDGFSPALGGLGSAVMRDPDRWPFLVLIPQKQGVDDEWEQIEDVVLAMVKRTEKDYRVDTSRRYLTGLSMGGHGTWVLAAHHPEMWAAIAPIAGYADATDPNLHHRDLELPMFTGKPADLAGPLKDTPVWAFHGANDTEVPVKDDEDTVAIINEHGGHARLTVYPNTGHNAWTNAYTRENLPTWFLQYRKP